MRLMDRFVSAVVTTSIVACGLLPTPAIAGPKDEMEAVRQEMEAYGEKLAELQTELVKGADELNITESQIVERRAEADKTQKKLKESQATLAKHIRENYRAGRATLVSVLLQAETLEDLVSSFYYLDKVYEQRTGEISEVRDLQTSYEEQITQLEKQEEEQQQMLEEAAEQAVEYHEHMVDLQAYYNELNAKVQAQLAAEAEAAAAARRAEAQAMAQAQAQAQAQAEADAKAKADADAKAKSDADTKAEADAQQAQQISSSTNEYGVITDGMENALAVVTEEVPTTTETTKTETSEAETQKTEGSDKTDAATDQTDQSKESDVQKSEEQKTGESKTDESRSDESKSDESKSDESKSDESKSGETKSDEQKAEKTDESSDDKKAEDEKDKQQESTAETTPKKETEQQATPEPTPEPTTEPTPEPEAPETPALSNDNSRQAIIDKAYEYLGVPYVWGGKSPDGFDCSGLTTYVYENTGIDVGGNRTTYALIDWMQENGTWKTSIDELQPGDMIFPSAGHVAIYLGDGKMIHAPHEGDVVRVADVYAFYGGGWAG